MADSGDLELGPAPMIMDHRDVIYRRWTITYPFGNGSWYLDVWATSQIEAESRLAAIKAHARIDGGPIEGETPHLSGHGAEG